MEKFLLPQVSKSAENILGNTMRVNRSSTPPLAGLISSDSPSSNHRRTSSPSENNGESNTSTAEYSNTDSDSDETIDVVKSAFKQVKSNARAHPYAGKDVGVRQCRKSSPIKNVPDTKKQETITASEGPITPNTTQPQKTVWRPY